MAINYFEQFVAPGVERNMRTRQLDMAENQMRYERDQQERSRVANEAFAKDFGTAWESGNTANLAALIGKHPGNADQILGAIGIKDQQQRTMTGNIAQQLSAAISSGNTNGALSVVQSNADFLRSIGQDPDELASEIQTDPQSVARGAESMMLLTMTPDQLIEYQQKQEDRQLRRDQMAVQMRGQDIQLRGQNLNASTAAQRLAFDQGKFAIEMQQAAEKADQLKMEAPKLSVNMEKALDAAVGDAATSRSSAASMDELASRWETEKPTSGIFGSAQSTWNKMTGSDTGLRDLRIRTSQFLNSQALKYLPPGPATDRDVELAREGVPTNMDDPALVARWLKAQARNEKRSALFNDFRAEWISAQGNPGQAKESANISGVDVKKGESFASAAKRYMAQAEVQVTGGSASTNQQSGFSNLWGG